MEATLVTAASEQVTIGSEYISITVTRKTEGDLLVSQFAVQRWYKTHEEPEDVLGQLLASIVATNSHEAAGLSERTAGTAS